MNKCTNEQTTYLNAYMSQNWKNIWQSNLDAVIPTKEKTIKACEDMQASTVGFGRWQEVDKKVKVIDTYLYKMEYGIDDDMVQAIEEVKNGQLAFIMFARARLFYKTIEAEMAANDINFFHFGLWACYWQAMEQNQKEMNACINGVQLYHSIGVKKHSGNIEILNTTRK